MACRNVWVTTRLNFGTTFLQLVFSKFFFMHKDIDITHFADGNTPYLSAKIAKDVVESLE